MSITDELREYVGNFYLFRYKDVREKLNEIADHIDIAHKHAIWYVDDRDPETMAENGWVRLPKDADGVPIHVGDVMELDSGAVEEVESMHYYGSGGWTTTTTHNATAMPSIIRHHHAPTVEDVLREFAQEMNENLGMYTGEAIDAGEWHEADERTIAEYAAKLRLAGDE